MINDIEDGSFTEMKGTELDNSCLSVKNCVFKSS